jgi:8-oxo-dGTP pyrophosphatase MutT (NUDIX family)
MKATKIKFFKDKSHGVILFKKEKNQFKVLIVKHKDGHFTFPKGHALPKEKNYETALRELYEETGIKNVIIFLPQKIKEKYQFQKNEKFYKKEVFYFVGYFWKKQNIFINKNFKNEITKALWINIKQANNYLFPSSLKVLEKAFKIFQNIYERN